MSPAAATTPSRPLQATAPGPTASQRRRVLVAASGGALFEWYDFYLFLVLAPVLSHHFLTTLPAARADAFVVLLFVAGFLTRPLGALLFGSLGDRWGRKTPFYLTLLVMALATANVALLPTQEQWGIAAPLALLLQRAMQGLALGGEYGGAVTLVAESAPRGRRGLYTGWLQTTASTGLLLALGIVAALRLALGEADFLAWGWRIPYAVSAILLFVGVVVRLRLIESPVFVQMQAQGRTAASPLRRLLSTRDGRRRLLLAVFGLTAGQAVIWYTGHVYTLVFLQGPLGLPPAVAQLTVALAMLLGLPLVVLAGWLSDRCGRRPLILAGLFLGAACVLPAFVGMERLARPAAGPDGLPVVRVEAPAAQCSVGLALYSAGVHSPCDDLRRLLIARGIAFELAPPASPGAADGVAWLRVGDVRMRYTATEPSPALRAQVERLLTDAGLLARASPLVVGAAPWWGVLALLVLLGACVALVYGPLAAALAELFPPTIRYSGTSLAYHLGNGVFGGLLPVFAAAAIARTGEPWAGLAYPVVVAVVCGLVALRWLPEGLATDIRR